MGADYFFPKDEFDTYEFTEKVKKIMANQERLGEDTDKDWGSDEDISVID